MINANMRFYPYSSLEVEDEYGQAQDTAELGFVKMSINLMNQTTADNIKYKDATYMGLTMSKSLNDTYIIHYDGDVKLKVLYVNPFGKYRQVYMAEM